MDPAPRISVCIPAYRRTEFLRRLLDSLAIQTLAAFEVVITDDSPDESVAELVRNHAFSPRIQYFKNPVTLGTPENWNEGLRRATGDWIKPMHDDDWFSRPDSLARFANEIQRRPADLIFSAFSNVYPDGRSLSVHLPTGYLNDLRKEPEILLSANRIGPPSAVLFRANGGVSFDRRMRWLVDIDFYIHYLKQAPRAVYVAESLVNIGISASQVTQSSFGNPAVEVPERFLLAGKTGYGSIHNWKVYDSWWRFLRNLSLRSLPQIRQAGYAGPVPDFLLSMMRWQNRVPEVLLRSGGFSKTVMFLHYLSGRKK